MRINYLTTLAILEAHEDVCGLVHANSLIIITDNRPVCDNTIQKSGRIVTQLQFLVSSSGCNFIHLDSYSDIRTLSRRSGWYLVHSDR